jgi:5-methylcytosine-specific restriction endonuclease McrA
MMCYPQSLSKTKIDHIVRIRDEGSGTPDNGQLLCRECNLKKDNNDRLKIIY